ncbi:unnamed protein product, partial [Symbiodinium pilosum]
MKSTALALAAQLHLPKEDRLSQGHHRDSAKLYSRNDTFTSLFVQRHIGSQVAQGWRPQRSMARQSQNPPRSLLASPWRIFTSRHEALRAGLSQSQPESEPVQSESPLVVTGSDSEPEEVERFAQTAPDTDSDAEEQDQASQEDTRLRMSAVVPGEACMSPRLTPCKHTSLRFQIWVRSQCASSRLVVEHDSVLLPSWLFAKNQFHFVDAKRASLLATKAHKNSVISLRALPRVPTVASALQPTLCALSLLSSALKDTGLSSISDFAYAYLDQTDLSDFISKQSPSLWEQLQVSDPEHCPAVARLRRALDMSQSITRAQDACPPSTAPAPSNSTAIATNVWAEHAPPRLDTEAVQRLQASFKANYPGEHLDSDSTPSIRLLSLEASERRPLESAGISRPLPADVPPASQP